VMPLGSRPAAGAPRATAGSITSRMYFGVHTGCGRMPFAISPAMRHIVGFTAARWIGMSGCAIGPGSKSGTMRRSR
jgi:hypothetical protein